MPLIECIRVPTSVLSVHVFGKARRQVLRIYHAVGQVTDRSIHPARHRDSCVVENPGERAHPLGRFTVLDERVDLGEGVCWQITAHRDPEAMDLPQIRVLYRLIVHKLIVA
jgi:hypothetical protein